MICDCNTKNHFDELLEATQKAPVAISQKGRTVAVVLSVKAFEQMQAKAEEKLESPSIEGILGWIEQHSADRQPMAEESYYHNLKDKFT